VEQFEGILDWQYEDSSLRDEEGKDIHGYFLWELEKYDRKKIRVTFEEIED